MLPTHPISLMNKVYRTIIPAVHMELTYWKDRACAIPNEELRHQALTSIQYKAFHCEGGSIMALTALENKNDAIKFIVAYQTISDYLDNLCDRSSSLDPKDFSALHESMKDALTVGADQRDYYRFREDRDDGEYLADLMKTCQSILERVPNYDLIKPYLLELCTYYCDLQIHKHVCKEERENRLKKWFAEHKNILPKMSWHEFSACSGSTLGIFCLVSYAMRNDFERNHAEMIREGYFPYIQGLHILLDYFIDQDEDREGGDLNFCFYYNDEEEMLNRFIHFLEEADRRTCHLPDRKFHKLINRGLLGIYLSDRKVNEQAEVRTLAKKNHQTRRGNQLFFLLEWQGLPGIPKEVFRQRKNCFLYG